MTNDELAVMDAKMDRARKVRAILTAGGWGIAPTFANCDEADMWRAQLVAEELHCP
jgi:hypothetical protein